MTAGDLRDDDPREVGGHRILARLGSGASGVVFLAESPDGGQVAIKVLHREIAASEEVRRRLRNEAEALRRVQSERVARVRSVETEGATPHLVMDLVEGETLEALVRRSPLAGPMVTAVAEGLVEALEAIHAAGIVHRDLKPSNVIFGQDGVRVVDFGVSAFDETAGTTRTGVLVGTPSWIAPEQATGAPIGPASDVFLLGMVVAYAATGAHPFGTGRTDAMLFRIVNEEPDLEGVPSVLRGIVEACLAKDPDQRPTLGQVAAVVRGIDVAELDRELPADRTYAASTTRLGAAAREEVAQAAESPARFVLRGPRSRRALIGALVLGPLLIGLVSVYRSVDASGEIVVLYSNAAANNPQLRPPQLIIRGADAGREVIDLPSESTDQVRVAADLPWKLSSELELEYLPSFEGSEPFTTIINPRRSGMSLFSRDREVRVSIDVKDTHTEVSITLPTLSGVTLSRREYLALELTRQNEQEIRRVAQAEASRARSECRTATLASWRSRVGTALQLHSNYREYRRRFGLDDGGTISEARYRNQMVNLIDAMTTEYAVLALIDPPDSEELIDSLVTLFDSYSALITAWNNFQVALLFPVRGSGLYSNLYPVQYGAMERAEQRFAAASADLGLTLTREVGVLCERRHPDPR
jgi:predicted Ser/Thr protein kinase